MWSAFSNAMISLLLKHQQSCLLALCVLLGLACGDLTAVLLGMKLGRGSLPQATEMPVGRPAANGDPTTDLAYILQHHLFNAASRTDTAPAFSLRPNDGETGEAAMHHNFELIGMVAAGKRSITVLRSGQQTKTYRLGDSVPGGGKIEEIVRHQVKIRNADLSLTTLTMHEGERTTPVDASPPAATNNGGGEVRAVGENRWVIPRAAAESVRNNLGEQLRMAQMQPRMIGDKTDGFIIKKITPGTLLAQMGLRRGDVIKHVNAMPIDSPEKALQILQQLREAREIGIDLERDGKPLSFAYAIE
jgi:general secretion pathway protein C